MNTQQISNLISILDSCSEIFNYPTEELFERVKNLGEITNEEELKNFSSSLEELEAEYIRLFSISATSNKTVPVASWWIDGKMMGRSFNQINDFYKNSGLIVDLQSVNLPQDHISLMCSFVAILLEEQQVEQALIFVNKYFRWLDKFAVSLNEASSLSLYSKTVLVLKDELACLEELS